RRRGRRGRSATGALRPEGVGRRAGRCHRPAQRGSVAVDGRRSDPALMARIAVVIPAYNHGRFVGEAVRSVLVQTTDDLELIVVDDGSPDDTLAVVEAIRDPRLRIITQRNGGTHAAINTG